MNVKKTLQMEGRYGPLLGESPGAWYVSTSPFAISKGKRLDYAESHFWKGSGPTG